MEIGKLTDVFCLQLFCDGSNILLQKVQIFRCICRSIPTEEIICNLVMCYQDICGTFSTPLGKHMGHFVITDAVFLAQFNKTVEAGEAKVVGVALLCDVDKLHAGPCGAYLGI